MRKEAHVDENAITFAESQASRAMECSESIGNLLEQLQHVGKPEDRIHLINMAQMVQRNMHTSLSAAVGTLKGLKSSKT